MSGDERMFDPNEGMAQTLARVPLADMGGAVAQPAPRAPAAQTLAKETTQVVEASQAVKALTVELRARVLGHWPQQGEDESPAVAPDQGLILNTAYRIGDANEALREAMKHLQYLLEQV